jgi:hypothetical protein
MECDVEIVGPSTDYIARLCARLRASIGAVAKTDARATSFSAYHPDEFGYVPDVFGAVIG